MRCSWVRTVMTGLFLFSTLPCFTNAQRTTNQRTTRTESPSFIRIDDMTGLGKRDLIETPVYSSSANKTIKQPKEWGKIEVTYEISQTAPEWIDNLIFEYFVITAKKAAGNQRLYSFYKKSVKYGDIQNETGKRMLHKSAVYLRPQAIERYGDLEAAAVEISYNGKVIAYQSVEAKGSKLPEGQWWKNQSVIKSSKVVTREGYLLNKDESPFVLLNIDSYEVIR